MPNFSNGCYFPPLASMVADSLIPNYFDDHGIHSWNLHDHSLYLLGQMVASFVPWIGEAREEDDLSLIRVIIELGLFIRL